MLSNASARDRGSPTRPQRSRPSGLIIPNGLGMASAMTIASIHQARRIKRTRLELPAGPAVSGVAASSFMRLHHTRRSRTFPRRPPNTADKLRRARPCTLVHDDSRTAEQADHAATPRLQPPFVCFIRLFCSVVASPTASSPAVGTPRQIVRRSTPGRSPTRPGRAWNAALG